MAQTFVSPMGDPTFASAAQSVADALFPNARRQAAARIAGAQYRGQELSNRQTELENVGLADENAAWAGDPAAAGMTPEQMAMARLGRSRATPQGLADMIGKLAELGFRRNAVSSASGGDYTGANAQLFGVASAPVQVDQIDDGYRLNPYDAGGGMEATGETLADIAAAHAQANASNASAGASSAREGYYRERTAHPQRFLSGAGEGGKPLPAGDSKMLTSEILARIPKGAKYSETDLAAAVGRAEQLRAAGQPIGTAAATAFDEIFGLDAKPAPVTRPAGVMDGLWDWLSSAQVPTGEQQLERRAPAAAAPAPTAPAGAPVRARNPKTGEVVELRNGQWVKVQ